MRTSESIKELSKAMAAFHGDIGLIIKNGKGNYGTYANVHGVIESISPILSKHGLSVRQFVDILTLSDGRLQQVLVTRISHLSGEFEEGVCILDPQEKGAQKLGSYLTYMRRYCLISAFSLQNRLYGHWREVGSVSVYSLLWRHERFGKVRYY